MAKQRIAQGIRSSACACGQLEPQPYKSMHTGEREHASGRSLPCALMLRRAVASVMTHAMQTGAASVRPLTARQVRKAQAQDAWPASACRRALGTIAVGVVHLCACRPPGGTAFAGGLLLPPPVVPPPPARAPGPAVLRGQHSSNVLPPAAASSASAASAVAPVGSTGTYGAPELRKNPTLYSSIAVSTTQHR